MRSEVPDALPSKIRIVVVHEQEMIRAGLCLLLSQQHNFEIVGSVSTWADAITPVRREQPDIVLLSVDPQGTGLEFLPELLAISGSTKVLVLSDSWEQELLRRAVRLGAAGALWKNNPAP